jgi:hypothetical protein
MTPLVDRSFQAFAVSTNADGSTFFIFDYAAGALPDGGGGRWSWCGGSFGGISARWSAPPRADHLRRCRVRRSRTSAGGRDPVRPRTARAVQAQVSTGVAPRGRLTPWFDAFSSTAPRGAP